MCSVEVADEVYARLRDLFEFQPELFAVTVGGLAINTVAVDEHVLRLGAEDAIPRSTACHAALRDRYLLRATQRFWVLLPEAFGVEECDSPARVADWRGANDCRSPWRSSPTPTSVDRQLVEQ